MFNKAMVSLLTTILPKHNTTLTKACPRPESIETKVHGRLGQDQDQCVIQKVMARQDWVNIRPSVLYLKSWQEKTG